MLAMLLGNILISILFSERFDEKWEILEDQVYYSKEEYHGEHSDSLLVAAHLFLPLVIAVTETALHMLSRDIFCVLRLCEVTIFLSSLFGFRIIETRLVIELADLLSSEKVKTESHIVYIWFNEQIYGFLFTFAIGNRNFHDCHPERSEGSL